MRLKTTLDRVLCHASTADECFERICDFEAQGIRAVCTVEGDEWDVWAVRDANYLKTQLDEDELQWARDHAAELTGKRTSFHTREGNEIAQTILGCVGELGSCKALNKRWEARTGNYKKADVGKVIQIRAVDRPDYRLRVVQRDDPFHLFISALVQLPFVFLRGWEWGYHVFKQKAECPQPDDREQRRIQNVHFLDTELLRAIETIPKHVLDDCPGPYRKRRAK